MLLYTVLLLEILYFLFILELVTVTLQIKISIQNMQSFTNKYGILMIYEAML